MKKRRTWQPLLLIMALALGLRIFLVLYPEVIHNDGIEYIRYAKEVLTGNWTAGKANPGYPVLIALVYSLVGNYELAGIWISVIFGVLLILPVFYLGKTIFNERVGIISSLVVAVHPILYSSSGSVLTESTYHFFMATSVLFGWYAFHKGRWVHALLFSLFASLAFLTRPEAIGFLLIFSVWVFFFNPPGGKRSISGRIWMILIATLAFLIFSSPFLIQIRKETGKWSISKKVDVSIGSFSKMGELPSIDEIRPWRKGVPLLSLVKDPLSLLVKMGTGLSKSFYRFQQGFHPLLCFFAVIGWIGIIRNRSRTSLKANLYILTHHFFYFALVFSILIATRRYTSQMIAISIPWAAFGLEVALEWILQRWKLVENKGKVATLSVALLLLILFIQGRVIHSREHREIQREAGLWMKDHLPRGVYIMSRLPQEAFYADLSWTGIPKKGYEEILQIARSKGVGYLVLDENTEERSPGFWGEFKKEDLILLKTWDKENQKIVVYEIIYPK
ncbi:MAG: glycosyltransferase family 39 protein [Syntrophaceae bacterium]|nr:glycosyltransferase family 39 protein [Syntrophaceae bacterium]